METKELERYKSMLREAFEKDFSDGYINVLIGNIHLLGWMDGWVERRNVEEKRQEGWKGGEKEC